jgi:hypothetical protein
MGSFLLKKTTGVVEKHQIRQLEIVKHWFEIAFMV